MFETGMFEARIYEVGFFELKSVLKSMKSRNDIRVK